jgi:hypothetical protein
MEASQVDITLGSLGSTGSRVRIDGNVRIAAIVRTHHLSILKG